MDIIRCNSVNFKRIFQRFWNISFFPSRLHNSEFRYKMDSGQSNSDQNQKNENGDKRQRPNTPEQPLKIIDLNDDCLVKIFGHLNLHSLFNVSLSNEYLRPAARIVYKRKFSQKQVLIVSATIPSSIAGPHECNKCIHVNGFQMELRYLRCFGASINDLSIDYKDKNNKRCKYIDQYINKYCAESLVQIKFLYRSINHVMQLPKPFINVQRVTVCSGDLSDRFPLFPQWFPNIHSLVLLNVGMDDHCNEAPFHHLQHMQMDINNGKNNRRNVFTKTEAAHLLQLNRQLDSLEIRMSGHQGMTMTTALNIIKDNPILSSLTVAMHSYSTEVKPSEIQRLASEHPTLVKLDVKVYKFTADTAIALIRQLNSLKQFHFQIDDPFEYNKFVSQLDNQWYVTIYTDFWHLSRRVVEMILEI